jgi:hypothetical protein
VTVDAATAQAQRQQLQWEGERRYNPLARYQDPTVMVSADKVISAVQGVVPVATANTSALSTLLGVIGLGAADDGSGKQGAGVEQTGMVQEKINFCESLKTVDCTSLTDPRMAECGFCLDRGTDSTGRFHIGGMYISSADQQLANEQANLSGQPAVYKPTVGACQPAEDGKTNFVLDQVTCNARANQFTCSKAGAATVTNPCGQCYGSTPANAPPLLYTGVKTDATGARLPFQAFLHLIYPGAHPNNGVTTTVTSGGAVIGNATQSNAVDVDHRVIPLKLIEGQPLTITVYGAPKYWAAWLSNSSDLTGSRVVSVDVGEQLIQPTNAYVIAGDKRAVPLTDYMSQSVDSAAWTSLQPSIPNTVLFYMRREEVMTAKIVSAFYGVNKGDFSQGLDVTEFVQAAAGSGSNINVSAGGLGVQDPAFGIVKHLWITQDDGNEIVAADVDVVPAASIVSNLTFQMLVPATLVDPTYADDLVNCPTGPMVLTAVGAGLMGSHSCFGPGGKFNPTAYCLQELWGAAGGTVQGTAYPGTDAAAAALVTKDSTGTPSLDATVSNLNNMANIAMYGVDMNGAPATFPTIRAAGLAMFGKSIANPCATIDAKPGAYTAECVDYLYRTSGNPGADSRAVDPTTLPYAYCTTAGLLSPLNPDGSVNQTNVSMANAQGPMASIRQYFQGIFQRSQDSSDFDAQAAAMRSCYGVNLVPPPETPSTCPAPNPDDWQCITPTQLQSEEVFTVCPGGTYTAAYTDAEAVCATYGARLAAPAEIGQAQARGAQWCSCSWANDGNAYYPMTQANIAGCGAVGVNDCGNMAWASSKGCVTCVGPKPPQGTADIQSFNPNVWNDPAASAGAAGGISAYKLQAGQPVCGSADGSTCYTFPDSNTCATFAQATATPQGVPSVNLSAIPAPAALGMTKMTKGRIVGRDDGKDYWVPNGTNIGQWFPACDSMQNGTNICDTSTWSEAVTTDQFNQKYIEQSYYTTGLSSVLDSYIKGRN